MISSVTLTKVFGDPSVNTQDWAKQNLHMWQVPALIHLAIPELPARIYTHKKFSPILERWLTALVKAGVAHEINTYDGCWNVRKKRGLSSLSIHSWAMAIDFNASHNPLGLTDAQCKARGLVPFTSEFIAASRPHVDCGADWKKRPDWMHFQIKSTDI